MGTTLDNGIYLPDEGERNCYEGLAGNWVALDNHLGSTNIHVTINDKQAWDGHVADTTIHVTSADKQAWNGHVADTTIHVTSADKQAWNGKADASALTAHAGDATIHVTAEDKQAWDGHVADSVKHVTAEDKATWNGKADASALTAHTGDTTIHVTAEDKATWNGKADASALTAHTGNTTIHVTSADKQAWNGKADASTLTAHTGDTTIHVTAADKSRWDAVTTKANDTDVVHKSGTETVGGKKTFTDEVTASRNTTNGALNLQNSIYDPKTNGQSAIDRTKSFSINVLTSTSDLFSAVSFYGASDRTIIRFTARYYTDSQNFDNDSLEYIIYGDGTKSFRPRNNNNTTLGENFRKWKNLYANQINGLTPSSLSMPVAPSSASYVDISSYITVLDSSAPNTYTPPSNGYITFAVTGNLVQIVHDYGLQGKWSAMAGNANRGFIPVLGGVEVKIYVTASNIDKFWFIPCQGNV